MLTRNSLLLHRPRLSRHWLLAGLVLALGVVLLATPMFARQGPLPVVWEPADISYTIGGGELSLPITVRFHVSASFTDVSAFTVPEIRQFMSVQPSTFAVLEPGMEYSLLISFAVPPRAAQGSYDGTVHLRLGSRTLPQPLKIHINVDYQGNVVSPTTASLSKDSLQFLTAVGAEGSTLLFSQTTPELSAIRPGSVLVLPPAPQLPYGFLGRVTNVTLLGSEIAFSTAAASLSEAFTTAKVNINHRLTLEELFTGIAAARGISLAGPQSAAIGVAPAQQGLTIQLNNLVLWDGDGHPETTDDQFLIDGNVSADPTLQFSFAVDNNRLSQLGFTFQLTESVNLTLKTELLSASLEDAAGGPVEKEFACCFTWSPLIVWAGWVPVVIVPQADFVARAKGTVSAGIQVEVDQASTVTAGVGYANYSWQPIADFAGSFTFSGPRFTAGANVKGYAGPRFKLLLYGIVGPRADLVGFGELDVDIFRTPIWEVFGGFEANAGVLLQVFDKTLVDQDFPLLIQYRRLLAEGGAGAQGSVVGLVRDAITREALPNAIISLFRDGDLIDTLLTNGSGGFSFPALVGAVYRCDVSRSGYLPVTYNNITVLPNETKTLDVILQVDTAHAGPGSVSGTVFNAISGAGVSGLAVNLRQGLNTTSGPAVAATTTGPGGTYSFSNLAAGNYTAEAVGNGFINSYFAVLCIGNSSTGSQNGVITPIIPPDEVRIVLTWGANPWDLDSHFTGPLPDGTRFHMFYPYADANLGSPWPAIVHLDLDDTTSFGPETTTLLQQITGVYRFSVHDYTNSLATSSTALSDSQAQVRVYHGSNLKASFNVPQAQPGTLWTVFEMEGETIRPINAMSYTGEPSLIMSPIMLLPMPEFDKQLLLNLPPKQP